MAAVAPNVSSSNDSLSDLDKYIGFVKASAFVTDPAERVGLIVELLILLAVGIFGNILLISVFFRRIRKNRSSYFYNYMVFGLALGDVCTMSFYIPVYLISKIVIIYDYTGCQFIEYVGAFLLWYVHLMICIAIPLERFFAICRPLTKFGKREVYIITACIIVFSVLMAIPFGFLSTVFAPDGRVIGCHFSYFTYAGRYVVPTLYFAVGAILVGIAFILYIIIFIFILRFRKSSQKLTKKDTNTLTELAAKTRVVVMLFGVTLFYFICWIPYFIIILEWIPLDNRYKALFFLNNAVNFILYGVLNKNIREDMFNVLRCKSPTKASQTHTGSSAVTNSSKNISQEGEQDKSAV